MPLNRVMLAVKLLSFRNTDSPAFSLLKVFQRQARTGKGAISTKLLQNKQINKKKNPIRVCIAVFTCTEVAMK